MKRQFDDQDRMYGNNKRHRSDGYNEALAEGKYELRFLIPTKSAGAIIGKGGESIKALRAKVCLTFNCFLSFCLCYVSLWIFLVHAYFRYWDLSPFFSDIHDLLLIGH